MSSRVFWIVLLFAAAALVIWRTHNLAYEAGGTSQSLVDEQRRAQETAALLSEIEEFRQARDAAEREQHRRVRMLEDEKNELYTRLRDEEQSFSVEFSDCFNMPVPDGLRFDSGDATTPNNTSHP